MIKSSKNFQLVFYIFCFFCAIFMLTNSGGIGFSEGEYSYWVAEQIIKHGRLGFSQPLEGVFEVAPNGITYASHEIGNTLFMLPTACVNLAIDFFLSKNLNEDSIVKIKDFILSFQPSIFSAVTATVFFSILHFKFSKNVLYSFIATICLAFTTYFWEYTRSLYDGVLCTTLLTTSFYYLLEYKETNKHKYLILAFLGLGFGFITRFPMILPLITSIVFASISTSRKDRVTLYTLIFLILFPFFLWQAFYNHLRTGLFYLPAVLLSKYAGTNLGNTDISFPTKFIGLLVSPGKGLLIYAPLLILSILFFSKFSKVFRKEAIYISATVIVWLLLHSNLGSNWYGAVGWGPRHLIVILPIAFIPFAVNIEVALRNVYIKFATFILAMFGFVLSISSIISNFQFRISYAREYGWDEDKFLVWGFWHSQSVDMIKAALDNIARILSGSPVIELANQPSKVNEYASSTLNVWANSLIYSGVPWYIAVLLTIPLFCLGFWALLKIHKFIKGSSDIGLKVVS